MSIKKEADEIEEYIKTLETELDNLKEENAFFRAQLEFITDAHARAVDRVNSVMFAKLEVIHQLEVLQDIIRIILEKFQLKAE